MKCDPVTNFALVTVSTGYDAAATSIVLSSGDGAKLPAPGTDGPFNLTWWNSTDFANPADDPNREIIRVTARSTDTLTVTRGQEGITATTKNTTAKTYKMGRFLTKLDYDNLSSIYCKIGTITRDLTAASGAVDTTGFGFQPKAVEFIACIDSNANSFSTGFSDGTNERCVYFAVNMYYVSAVQSVVGLSSGGNYQLASCSFLTDGIRLTWTKTGSPTGTLTIYYKAIR